MNSMASRTKLVQVEPMKQPCWPLEWATQAASVEETSKYWRLIFNGANQSLLAEIHHWWFSQLRRIETPICINWSNLINLSLFIVRSAFVCSPKRRKLELDSSVESLSVFDDCLKQFEDSASFRLKLFGSWVGGEFKRSSSKLNIHKQRLGDLNSPKIRPFKVSRDRPRLISTARLVSAGQLSRAVAEWLVFQI